MKLQLPDNVSSAQDLKAVTLEVRQYARWYAHAAIKQRSGAGRPGEAPALSPAAKQLIHDWSAQKPLTQAALDGLIRVLEDFADSAPALTITLAAPPTSGLKSALVAWCRKNIAPDVMVSFQFNATLLGGMVVRYGSHIFDWSFRRQILDARMHFPEVLRNV